MLEGKTKEATNKYEQATETLNTLVKELEEQRKLYDKKTREVKAYKEALLRVLTNGTNVANGNNQIVKETLGDLL